MALTYTTVKEFWEFLGFYQRTSDFQAGNTPSRETVASTPVTAGDYYLDQLGVDEDNLTLYVGSSNTALTPTTDYTFNSDTSTITITSAGAAELSGEDLTAVYGFCSEGETLNYNKTKALLERTENAMEEDLDVVFTTLSAAGYEEQLNELQRSRGGKGAYYFTYKRPIVKVHTAVNGAYTTGGATITVDDGTGLPTGGATIYIGGNKVTYTSRTGNDLTVPTATPSIADDAEVRMEVIEVSTDSSGSDPTYTVLTPNQDYSIDYNTGKIQLMDQYYYLNDANGDPEYGVEDRLRFTYYHAWHDINQDPVIPDEIEELIYMMAGRKLLQRTVFKSHIGGRDNFDPQQLGFSKKDIEEIKQKYRQLRVLSSN